MTSTQNISNIKTIDDLKINNIYTNDVIAKFLDVPNKVV